MAYLLIDIFFNLGYISIMVFRKRMGRRKMVTRRKGKRRFKKNRKSNIARQLVGFPTNKVVKMRYCTNATLISTGITPLVDLNYRCNSIFDPDQTGVGHQPLGHDNWSQFYANYTVLGSKIRVSGATMSSGNSCIYGVYLSTASTPVATTYTTLVEQGKSKYRFLQGAINGNVPSPINLGFSTKKWFNVKDVKDSQNTLGASFSSNPTNEAFFTLWAANTDGVSASVEMRFVIVIDYIVMLSDPLELSES